MHGTCTECDFTGELRRSDLCGPCYQRHWKAGTLPPIKRTHRAPRVIRDCQHPRTPHRHGTRTAYVLDRCRCDSCTTANRTAMANNRQAKNLARWNPEAAPFIAGDIVRAHLRELMAAGMGWKRIAQAAGVRSSTVYPILYGKYVDDPLHPEHRPPRKQVRRDVAEKLLAVHLDLAPGGLIDGTGTRRRLQALIAIGWPQSRLAQMLGMTPASLSKVIHSEMSVRKSTAAAVKSLYEDRWHGGPQTPDARSQGIIAASKRLAALKGWAPPMAWDDDEIDDPAARPHCVDAEAVRVARISEVERRLAAGASRPEVCRRLRMRGPTDVERMLERGGRSDLAAQWRNLRNPSFVRNQRVSA